MKIFSNFPARAFICRLIVDELPSPISGTISRPLRQPSSAKSFMATWRNPYIEPFLKNSYPPIPLSWLTTVNFASGLIPASCLLIRISSTDLILPRPFYCSSSTHSQKDSSPMALEKRPFNSAARRHKNAPASASN